jgi:hypothetical protein
MNNSGSGSLLHFQEGINSIYLVWQPYARQYGSVGIKFAFEKKLIKNPSVILHSACSFMWYWAGLHSLSRRS